MSDQRNRVGKEKILEKAEKLFTEQGYQAVSIRSIADACGVTNAALYYHFDDKSSLFAEVMKRHTKNLSEHICQAGEAHQEPQAKITAMAQEYVHLVSNRRPLMFLVRHQAKDLQQNRHQKQLFDMLGKVLEPFDEVFNKAVAQGEVRKFPEGYSGASILVGMIHGLNAYCWVRTDHMIEEEDVSLLVDFFWNGIKKRGRSRVHRFMMKNVRRALGYLLPYWKTTLGALFSLLLVNAANLSMPQLLRLLIDEGIQPLDMHVVWLVVGGLVLAAIVRGIFNFTQRYWSEIASQGVAFDFRNTIFRKLQNLSFSYHDQSQTGKLMTRMTSDVEMVRMFVGRGVVMLLSAVIMLLGTMAFMLTMNWRLALVVFLILPAIFILFSIFIRRIMPVFKSVQQKLSSLNSILQENLAGMRVVKAFAREIYEMGRYGEQNQILLGVNIHLMKLTSALFPLIFMTANFATVGVVWVGGNLVIGETLSLGGLVAFIGYISYLLQPVFMMGMIGAMLSRAEASGERIFEVMDAESEVKEREDAKPLSAVEGKVTFEDVSFRYVGGQEDVIHDLSFVAHPGETVAILGQTGTGKSSIINLIPRFYDVTSGRVMIDGFDVRDVTIDSLRKQIGIVLQESNLFSGTIRENIAYGRPDAKREDIISAAKAAQAHPFISELPQGYEMEVGERGVGLSGGQKQRVAIARALLVDPRILILDDSTSSVDAETEYKIQQALDDLMVGRTSFVIAQRISTVRDADRILLLDDGHLVAEGTHGELLRSSELYVDILETQFDEEEVPVR